MKLSFFILFVFVFLNSYAQKEKFLLEGRIMNSKNIPVADAYVINFSDLDKRISLSNGVFNIWVFPEDSLLISHVSYIRKVATVYSILGNPVVQLQQDTINILEVNVSPNYKSDEERARENIDFIKWNIRPQPGDLYTETERSKELMNTENKVEHAASTQLYFIRFSPSEQI